MELSRLDLDCPEDYVYLVEWCYELIGRSGAGMGGINPLSYQEIEAWSRLYGLEISSLEVKALIHIDAALRRPEDFLDEEEADPVKKDDWGPRKKNRQAE